MQKKVLLSVLLLFLLPLVTADDVTISLSSDDPSDTFTLNDRLYRVDLTTGGFFANPSIIIRDIQSEETGSVPIEEMLDSATEFLDLEMKVKDYDLSFQNGRYLITITLSISEKGGATVKSSCALKDDMVAWWPANGNANDIIGGNDGTEVNGAGYSGDSKLYQYNGEAFGMGTDGAYIRVPDSSSLDVTSLTIEAWINSNDLNEFQRIVYKHGSYDLLINENGNLYCIVTPKSDRNTGYGIGPRTAS